MSYPIQRADRAARMSREFISSSAASVSIPDLVAEAVGAYDKTATTLKTNKVANFSAAATEYLSLAHASAGDLIFTGDFTISIWYKAFSRTDCVLTSKWSGAGGTRSWFIHPRSGGAIYFGCYTTAGDSLISTGLYTAGAWAHIVMVRDGTTLRPYVDGVAKSTAACGSTICGDTSSSFDIGAYGAGGLPANGDVSCFSAYSRALSAAEVTALYNSGTPKVHAELAGAELTNLDVFHHLNELGGVRYDAVNSNNLTDNNTVGSVAGPVEYQATDHAAITKMENRSTSLSAFPDLTLATLNPVLEGGAPTWNGSAKGFTASDSLTQPWTLFVVFTPNSPASALASIMDSSGAGRSLFSRNTTNFRTFAGSVATAGTYADLTRTKAIVSFNGASSETRINGAATAQSAGTNGMDNVVIGDNNISNAKWKGTIEYAYLFDRLLTTAEKEALETL